MIKLHSFNFDGVVDSFLSGAQIGEVVGQTPQVPQPAEITADAT